MCIRDRPIPGGTYAVSDALLADLKAGVQGQHASNLGGILAREIGDSLGVPLSLIHILPAAGPW